MLTLATTVGSTCMCVDVRACVHLQERCNLGSIADCMAAGHTAGSFIRAPMQIIGILAQVGVKKGMHAGVCVFLR